MFNFSASTTSPAFKSHLQTQVNFFADFSQKMIDGMQKLSALNIQVAKTVLDESASNTKALLSSKDQHDAIAVLSSQTQPSLEKVRAYRQHVQRIVSDTQADVAKSVEAYVPEATRTTQEVVQIIAKRASEQTTKVVQRQQEAVSQFASAAKQNVNIAADQAVSTLDQEKEITEKLTTAAKQSAQRAVENSAKAVITK